MHDALIDELVVVKYCGWFEIGVSALLERV